MRDSALKITDSDNGSCRGSSAATLVCVDRNATDVSLVRLPRIFLMMRENIVRVLGIIRAMPSGKRLSLNDLGVCYRAAGPNLGCYRVLSWIDWSQDVSVGQFLGDLFGFGDGPADFSLL